MRSYKSKGFGLKPYQKDLAEKLVNEILTKSGRIHPTSIQDLFDFWNSEGTLLNGDCMSFREYARSIASRKINRKAQWEDFEESLRIFMGERFYNKI